MRTGQKNNGKTMRIACSVLAASVFATAALSAAPIGVLAEERDASVLSAQSVVADMDGLQIWYDATDISLASGEKIAELVNKAKPTLSGVGNAVQSTSNNRPTYVAESDINGRPAVRLDAQSYMRVGGTNGFYLDDMTIIVVGNMNYDGTGTREILSRLHSAPFNHNWYFNLEGGFNYGWGSKNGNTVAQYQSKTAFDYGSPTVLVGRKSGTYGMSMINGAVTAEFAGSSPQSANDPVYLGGIGTSADCDIGEVLIFNRGLSDGELRSINTYLFDKWGFESSDGCTLNGIYSDGKLVAGFSPYKHNYCILGSESDMDKITAVTRYDGATASKSVNGNTVTFTVTNPLCNESTAYTVTAKNLPDKADRLNRLGIADVTLNDGYWKDTITQYMTYSLDYIYDMFEFSYSFDNFDRIARGERKVSENTSVHAGQILIPSGDNKLIGDKDGSWNWGDEPWREGLIYEEIRAVSDFIAMYADDAALGQKSRELKARTEGYVDRIVAAGLTCTGSDRNGKRIDGYFDTYVMLTQTGVIDEAESGHIWDHDMYNFGCLIEAGMSWYRATGDTRLLFVATRFCEFLVDYMYGEGGYDVVPSHQIAEETLLALYNLYASDPDLVAEMKTVYRRYDGIDPTDRYFDFDIRYEKYKDIVRDWIEKRGVQSGRYNYANYGNYAQDHATYDKQTTAVGHAVRANLWYSGIAAAGNAFDNADYIAAANTIWNNIVDHQMYVNGGTGSTYADEAYGGDDFLPHDGYCETCAAVGMGFFALNMSDIFGDAEYADVLELEMYNGILGCLGADGQSFYYQNPLTADEYQRPYWSGATPCCPPMYMKFFSMLPTYIYSYNAEKLVVNQYISSFANVIVGDTAVEINQYADLPDGDLAVFDVKADGAFKLALRSPSWAKTVTVKIDGQTADVEVGADGYIELDRMWSGIVRVEIKFTKQAERIYQLNAVANKGQVAFRYGPLLYCAESIDNTVDDVDLVKKYPVITQDSDITAEYVSEMFDYKTGNDGKNTFKRGTYVLKTDVLVSGKRQTLTLIPYYLRGNRTHESMRVWFWEQSIAVGGIETQTFDTQDSLDDFELFGANGYVLSDGELKSDSRIEAKAIYKPRRAMSDFTVSADFRHATTYMNNGLYILASGATAEQDKIDALNVHIEHSQGSNTFTVSLFKFTSTGGYMGQLKQSDELPVTDTIRLSVTVYNGAVAVSANGEECLRYVLQASDPSSGDIGIRSMMCAAYIDNFAVMSKDIPLHKGSLEEAVAAAEAKDRTAFKTDGVNALNAALENAKIVLETAVNDFQINQAEQLLNAALQALVAKSDTAALDSAIARAEAVKLDDYTEETVAVLTDALNAAKALTADDEQTVIDQAESALIAAMNGLCLKSDTGPTATDGESNGLSGGAIAGIVVGSVAAVGASVGAVYCVRKKKKGKGKTSE